MVTDRSIDLGFKSRQDCALNKLFHLTKVQQLSFGRTQEDKKYVYWLFIIKAWPEYCWNFGNIFILSWTCYLCYLYHAFFSKLHFIHYRRQREKFLCRCLICQLQRNFLWSSCKLTTWHPAPRKKIPVSYMRTIHVFNICCSVSQVKFLVRNSSMFLGLETAGTIRTTIATIETNNDPYCPQKRIEKFPLHISD